ncbi:MAG: DUF2796 domain-containing protein [Deltaproteobacteria bacterium]|jgi:hypothetical protein|nr:DUF2796 domain-containing protein [Deltaproteobacteria bacterium]
MFKCFALTAAVLAAFFVSQNLWAQTQPAHEHGAARLNVSIENDEVEIRLQGPLASFISFEHRPTTEAQINEVRDMAFKLNQPETLFIFPKEAACQLKELYLSADNIDREHLYVQSGQTLANNHHRDDRDHNRDDHDHDHDDGDHNGHDHGDHGEHGELTASYEFKCQDYSAVNSIELALFKIFPNLSVVRVQSSGLKGQRAFELKSDSPSIKW